MEQADDLWVKLEEQCAPDGDQVLEAAVAEQQLQTCGLVHPQVNRGQPRDSELYSLFDAAASGCLQCTKYYVELRKVNINTMSASKDHTALDFAQHWGHQLDTTDVQKYMLSRGSTVKQGRAATGLEMVMLCGWMIHGFITLRGLVASLCVSECVLVCSCACVLVC